MENYVILKWGSLKAYQFSDSFVEKNKEIVEQFVDFWDKLYENHCTATGASDELQNKDNKKQELVNILEKLFDLGTVFENGFDDTYYNTFDEIKDYIMNYGG